MSDPDAAQALGTCRCRVVITGAAGNVGAMCAQGFAKAGAKLALVDIDRVMARRIANDIGAEPYCLDVLSEVSVARFTAQLAEQFGTADLLINAAGRGFVRTLGMMRVTRALARTVEDAPLTVVNVGTRDGLRGDRFDYAGSTLAFHRLSEGLGAALGKPNLKIMTIASLESEEEVEDLVRQICGSQGKRGPEAPTGSPGQAA